MKEGMYVRTINELDRVLDQLEQISRILAQSGRTDEVDDLRTARDLIRQARNSFLSRQYDIDRGKPR